MERKYIVAIGLAIVGGIIAGKVYRSSTGPLVTTTAPAGKITWDLPTAIDEAAGYLTRVNDENGRFIYRMGGDGKHIAPKKYNIVRHAGAIYAMADYQVQGASADGRAKAAAATERAANELITHYVRPLKSDATLLGVWSDPKEEGGGPKLAAKLGGAGLSIIGLMGRYRAVDGGAPGSPKELETAQGLARFVQFMQKPNGDYVSKYTDEDGKVSDFESLYYPGEATLGLTMLYEADHDEKWLATAMKGVGQLVVSRRTVAKAKLPADHWLMIAIDRLAPFYDKVKEPPVTKDEMIDHAITLGMIMIEGQTKVSQQRPEIDGCFTRDGRTTPSATRLEGLLALEHALMGDEKRAETRKEIRAAIVKGISFLRRSQITTGPARGGIPAALVPPSEDGGAEETELEGDEKSSEIRIDFVQHAMSAMMRYTVMCKVDATGCP
ncbi:MAG: hypothetical protein U0270_08170 [Labilithrix sp.]